MPPRRALVYIMHFVRVDELYSIKLNTLCAMRYLRCEALPHGLRLLHYPGRFVAHVVIAATPPRAPSHRKRKRKTSNTGPIRDTSRKETQKDEKKKKKGALDLALAGAAPASLPASSQQASCSCGLPVCRLPVCDTHGMATSPHRRRTETLPLESARSLARATGPVVSCRVCGM